MKQKLPDRDKYFWKQVGVMFLIYIVAGVILSYVLVAEGPNMSPNFGQGFGYVSILSTIYLIFKVAMDFTDRAYPQKH